MENNKFIDHGIFVPNDNNFIRVRNEYGQRIQFTATDRECVSGTGYVSDPFSFPEFKTENIEKDSCCFNEDSIK